MIHEPFERGALPCPKQPVSTVDEEGCAEQAILRSDRAINARVKRIYELLRYPSARASFVRGERSWLAYRRANCDAESSVYTGGTARPLLYLSCEGARNKTHLSDLADILAALKPH